MCGLPIPPTLTYLVPLFVSRSYTPLWVSIGGSWLAMVYLCNSDNNSEAM